MKYILQYANGRASGLNSQVLKLRAQEPLLSLVTETMEVFLVSVVAWLLRTT